MRSLSPSAILSAVPLLIAAPAAAAAATPAADFLVARALAEEGRLEEALARLEPILAIDPTDLYLRLERTDLLLRTGRLDEASAEARRARELSATNPDALRLQGRVELARADRDEAARQTARDAYQRLREQAPEDLEALVSLGQLELGSGNFGLAAEALAEAARLRPGHPGIESLLARALEGHGDPVQAERIQRARLEREPGSLVARLELADLLGLQQRHLEAARVLEQASAGQRSSFEVRRRLGLHLFLAGESERALELARGVVADWPSYGGARLLAARIELAHGRFEAAHEVAAPLFGGGPMAEAIADLRLRILEGLGRLDEAAAQLEAERGRLAESGRADEADERALEIARLWGRAGRWDAMLEATRAAGAGAGDQTADESRLLAATALSRLGRAEEALAELGAAEAARPRFAARRIGVLLDAGRAAQAETEIASLLAGRPDADLAVAVALVERERFERAIPLLESARARDAASLEAGFRLASAYERVGRLEDAVPLFRGILERAPDFAPALNYLGYVWIDRAENLAEALEMVERAVRLDPGNGAYVDSLGWGYLRSGRIPEAVAALERAARLLPDDATVLEHLGDACLAAGERGRAADAYRRAARAAGDPASAAARKLAQLEGES